MNQVDGSGGKGKQQDAGCGMWHSQEESKTTDGEVRNKGGKPLSHSPWKAPDLWGPGKTIKETVALGLEIGMRPKHDFETSDGGRNWH
jgi:hypothetical protein